MIRREQDGCTGSFPMCRPEEFEGLGFAVTTGNGDG